MAFARGWGEGKRKSDRSTGIKFQLREMIKFQRSAEQPCAYTVNNTALYTANFVKDGRSYHTHTHTQLTNTSPFITPSKPTATWWGRYYYLNFYFSLSDQENKISRVISDLPKLTQCVNAGSWFQTQAFTFQALGTLSDSTEFHSCKLRFI